MENTSSIQIHNEVELAKVVAFARAGVRRMKFAVPVQLVDPLLGSLEKWLDEVGARAVVDVVRPNGTTLTICVGAGLGAGALAGWLVGGPLGAAIGASVGAIVGVAAAHVRIRVELNESGSALITLNPA